MGDVPKHLEKTHAGRYGVKTYSLEQLAKPQVSYLRGIVGAAFGYFLIYDVMKDYDHHMTMYLNPDNRKFHFYQEGKSVFGETGGTMGLGSLNHHKYSTGAEEDGFWWLQTRFESTPFG